MIYLGLEYLPHVLQKIYAKYYKYLDVILTYATLSKGYPSFAYLEPTLFIEYLRIAVKILKEADDKKSLAKYYKKKIKNLSMETFVLAPDTVTYYLKNKTTTYYNYPPNNYPPNNYPPNNYPPNDYPPNNYPPNNYPPNNYPPNDYPPNNYPPNDYPPNGDNIAIALKYSLKDRYAYLLWTIKNDLLHPYHIHINGLSGDINENNITFNDLIRVQNKLKDMKVQNSSDMYVSQYVDHFFENRVFSINATIKLVYSIMASLYKQTGKSYENAHAPLKFLLKDAIYYTNYEPTEVYINERSPNEWIER